VEVSEKRKFSALQKGFLLSILYCNNQKQPSVFRTVTLGGIRSLVSDSGRTPNAESVGRSDPLEVGDDRCR